MHDRGSKFHVITSTTKRWEKVYTSFDANDIIAWDLILPMSLGWEDPNKNPSNGIITRITKKNNNKIK